MIVGSRVEAARTLGLRAVWAVWAFGRAVSAWIQGPSFPVAVAAACKATTKAAAAVRAISSDRC
jgi:hypothetical protein